MQPAAALQTPGSRPVRPRQWRTIAYVLPALVMFGVFTAYPLVDNVVWSLYHVTLTGKHFVGLTHYAALFQDPVFAQAFKNSLLWIIGTLVLEMFFGYLLALLIEEYLILGRGFFRTLFFIPMVVTPTIISIVFSTLYAPNYGAIAGLWQSLFPGAGYPGFLSDPNLVNYTLIGINAWQWTGFFVLLYVAGLSQIPLEVREAALVDGATFYPYSARILLPMLRPTHITLIVLGTVQALQQFPLVYLITGGGPDNASQILGTDIFQEGFVLNHLGYGATIATVLLALALVLVLLQIRLLGGGLGSTARVDL